MTHMPQAISARSQPDHSYMRREPSVAASPRFVAQPTPFGVGDARTLQTISSGCRRVSAACRLAPSLDYMRAHLDQPINISTLSAMAGLSPSSLFGLFRKVTGDTPLNWFIRARMRRACELLARTNLPIKQIADQVGYRDPLYFSRVFKSVHGMSPKSFRTQKRTHPAAAFSP